MLYIPYSTILLQCNKFYLIYLVIIYTYICYFPRVNRPHILTVMYRYILSI